MAQVPEDLYYSKDHEWVRVDGEVGTIGITDHAQKQLGDIVFLTLPQVGENFPANEEFGTVESVKAANEIYTPISGEVVEVNQALLNEDNTPVINADPYGEGWMLRIRMSNPGEIDKLMTAAEYEDFTKAKETE